MVLGAYVASASMKVSQTLSARMVAQSLRSHIDRSRGQSNLRNTRRLSKSSKLALRNSKSVGSCNSLIRRVKSANPTDRNCERRPRAPQG